MNNNKKIEEISKLLLEEVNSCFDQLSISLDEEKNDNI